MPRPFQRFRIVNATNARRVKGSATTTPASNPVDRVVDEVPSRAIRQDAVNNAVNNVTTVKVSVTVWSDTSGAWETLLLDKTYSSSMNNFIDDVIAHVRTDPNDDTKVTADVFVREGPAAAASEASWDLKDGDDKTIELRSRPIKKEKGPAHAKRQRRRAPKPKP